MSVSMTWMALISTLCLSNANLQSAEFSDAQVEAEEGLAKEMKFQLLQAGTSNQGRMMSIEILPHGAPQNQTVVPVPPQKDIVVPVSPELGYLRYEFEVLGVKNPGLANSVEYSEFDLFEGDKKIEGWEMDQVYSPGAEHPEKAKFLVDNDCLTSFMDKRKIGSKLVIKMKRKRVVDSFRFWTSLFHPERDPVMFKFKGSNTYPGAPDLEWDLLYSQETIHPVTDSRETPSHMFVLGFKFIRFTPLQLRNTEKANGVQLADFFLYGPDNEQIDLSNAKIENPGGEDPVDCGPGECDPTNLLDGDEHTKWADSALSGSFIIELPQETAIRGYNFRTSDSRHERDPIKWRVEGARSMPGVSRSWKTLSEASLSPPLDAFWVIPVQAVTDQKIG